MYIPDTPAWIVYNNQEEYYRVFFSRDRAMYHIYDLMTKNCLDCDGWEEFFDILEATSE